MIKLANYKIKRKIASGGMGDVYLAEHEHLDTVVAIKSLHSNLVGDESFRKRFRTEAKIQSKLVHPNIVKLIDFQEHKDGLYLIMEYIDGKQLNDYIKQDTGPITEEKLIPLFSKVLSAIDYAHGKGLVHRDIKPANILITTKGDVKLIDFGIAKNDDQEDGLTKTGVQVGTVSYMSPEQVNAEKLDKLTDIYSLGVTLFQMAVGQSPYIAATNTFKIQLKIVNEPFPNPKDIYPSVSDKLVAIIEKATKKDKKDRYKSCEEFKTALNASSEESKVNKPPKVKKEAVKSPSADVKESSSSSKVLTRALLIGLVLFLGYLFMDNNSKQKKADDYYTYYNSAKKYQADELYQSAINYYNKCINIYSDRDSIIALKAECYYEQELYQTSITTFSRAIEVISNSNAGARKTSDYAKYYSGRGKSYSALKKHSYAQGDFDQAISRDANNAEYHLLKGNDFFIQGMYNSAKKTYTKSISLENSDWRKYGNNLWLYTDAYYKRGNANYKLGKLADAIYDYTQAIYGCTDAEAIKLNPDCAKAYRNRGIARYETCKSGACSDLKKAGNLGDSKAYNEYQRIKNKDECE